MNQPWIYMCSPSQSPLPPPSPTHPSGSYQCTSLAGGLFTTVLPGKPLNHWTARGLLSLFSEDGTQTRHCKTVKGNYFGKMLFLISSVQFSRSVVSDSLRPHESQHARLHCPSPTPRVYSDSCPLSRWCHPTISSSVVPFSSCPQSLPALGSFPMSQLFAWGGQSTGVSASASVLPMNTQEWSPWG